MNENDSVKKSSVSAGGRGLGLLTPSRQRLFFRGIAKRSDRGVFDRRTLEQKHAEATEQLEQEIATQKGAATEKCRLLRRAVLRNWDQGDEQRIAAYESQTLKARDEKNRELAKLRKERKRSVSEEEQQYDAAVAKVDLHFKTEKPKIAKQQKLENERLVTLLGHATNEVESVRQLTMRRLGGPHKLANLIDTITQSAGPESQQLDVGDTVAGAVEKMEQRIAEIQSLHQQMVSGVAVKFVESYYLIFPVIAIVVAWCGGVYAAAPSAMGIWMLGALPCALIGGFLIHTLSGMPVRKNTRILHPKIELCLQQISAICASGQALASNRAVAKLDDLTHFRKHRLEQLRSKHEYEMLEIKNRFRQLEDDLIRTHDQRLEDIETSFVNQFTSFSSQMKGEAEREANRITTTLEAEQRDAELRREQLHSNHEAGLNFLQNRVHTGVVKAFRRALETGTVIRQQFPEWQHVTPSLEKFSSPFLRWLPLGSIQVRDHLPGVEPTLLQLAPATLPLVLARETQAALIVDCPSEQMHVAAEWVRGILWRAMTSVTPGRMRLTLLDTVGRGENFASLVALGDHDPSLIGHRAWSATSQVNARLSELTQYVEDILQTCLRDRYATIEDFNREAGPLAEPYRLVAAFGAPTGLSRDAIESLRALIEGGRRCGVFTIIVKDTSQPWPAELPALPVAHVLRLRIDESGRIRHLDPTLEPYSISPVTPPPSGDLPKLAEAIGLASLAANRIEIPLDDLVPAVDYDSQDSATGLSIPVGRQGVGRSLEVQLGSGMRQHMLVAGKTGSGKSTLLHAMIMAASMRYTPDQLHLYLLDFKKGVEFKIYADTQLPHARVIGIESEREFGRSVLQRLDEELQHRGELFRETGVQEMAEYRRKSQQDLPRIMLVVDEFQELFTRDDRIAQDCTMLLDRLVRQGRSFGMHVILSSQSLAGAYTLPRATLGQMAVRIALQCSEADAAMILADDNTAARLLSRPGEAIFNDAGGLVEGNQPFQVAWMGADNQRQRLANIAATHRSAVKRYGPALVFEGNRPAVWTPELADAALSTNSSADVAVGLLGEAVRIGPPTTLRLLDAGGRNIICVADQKSVASVMATWVSSAAKYIRAQRGAYPRIVVFEGRRGGDQLFSLSQWLDETGIATKVVRPRESQDEMAALACELGEIASVDRSLETKESAVIPTLIVIDELERFRDLRQDETFGFSLDGSAAAGGGVSLQKLLSDGPAAGFHTLIGCAGSETLSRWLPRTSHHDLELRIVGRVSANDSAQLIDTPEASNLSPASMLLYDDAVGTLEKFRLCEIPRTEEISSWLG